jgi:hypothetical protein
VARGTLMDFLTEFRGQESAPAGPWVPLPDVEAAEGLPPAMPLPGAPVPRPSAAPVFSAIAAPNPVPPVVGTSRRSLDFRQLLRDLPEYRARLFAFLSFSWVEAWLDTPVENPLATASMFLGLASIVLPILAVPSVIMARVCLRRLPLEPWRKGKARAVTGIVASAVLAPISLVIWISVL